MNRRTFFLAFVAVVSAPMVLAKGRPKLLRGELPCDVRAYITLAGKKVGYTELRDIGLNSLRTDQLNSAQRWMSQQPKYNFVEMFA